MSLGQQARQVVQTLADVMAKTLPCYAGTVSTELCAKAEMGIENCVSGGAH